MGRKMTKADDKIKEIEDKISQEDIKIEGYIIGLEETTVSGWNDPTITSGNIARNAGLLLGSTSKKSALITEKLSLSVEKLHESSKQLERYTSMLIVLTIVLILMTFAITLFPIDFPLWAKGITMFVIVIIVIIAFPLKK